MATKLSISDLANVLAELNEVSKPYQLGIQLNIDTATLKAIEKDYQGDSDRQKTEVIEHWLRNSPDPSWPTLAKAVERMGGHAKLVKVLRVKELGREGAVLSYIPLRPRQRTDSYSLDGCVRCVLLLGKMGHGTSTLGNRMLNRDAFKINDKKCPHTSKGSSMLRSGSQHKDYIVQVYDHAGLFKTADTPSDLPKTLNLVVFVLKCRCSFDMDERKILEGVVNEWQISGISALVITHCDSEDLSEEEREKMIKQFKKEYPSIDKLMGKGILAVGFPDSSHIQSESQLSQRVEEDKSKLRELIYSCDEEVTILHAEKERRLNLEKEFESSLNRATSVPAGLSRLSQAYLQREGVLFQHGQIERSKSDSHTSQTDDSSQLLQAKDDKISQPSQTNGRCCSIL